MRQRIELFGFVALALPFFGLLLLGLAPQALASWQVSESFSQVSGLAGFWFARLIAVVAVGLALYQALARVIVDATKPK